MRSCTHTSTLYTVSLENWLRDIAGPRSGTEQQRIAFSLSFSSSSSSSSSQLLLLLLVVSEGEPVERGLSSPLLKEGPARSLARVGVVGMHERGETERGPHLSVSE